MQVSSTGAVRGQSETKHDILRAPRESLLVFCLILDYQYPVMNINCSGIHETVKRPNQHAFEQFQTVKIMEVIKLLDTLRVLNRKECKFSYCSSSTPLKCKGQIYLLGPQTFMLQLQIITCVIVKNFEAVSVQYWGC